MKFENKSVSESIQDSKIGPSSSGVLNAPTRILVVDDQVFNIEFLRCQLELIPTLAGRCDYVDNGISAIKLI